jgi:hypothetical protein
MLTWLAVAGVAAADERAEPSVALQAGLVSARFTATPAALVSDVIRRATAVEIVIPSSALARPVTLTVERVPLEDFLRRLLVALDLGGFALVY